MKYLLDTCVLSEFVKVSPNKQVLDCMYKSNLFDLFISSLSIGEIWKGISKLPKSRRKVELNIWFNREILEKYNDRIIPFNKDIAKTWGELKAMSESEGKSLTVIDSLIAATTIHYDFVLVTRNIKDFIHTGCELFNPWE